MNIGSETVFEIVNVTLPHLREGLDMDSARETVRAIREKASVGAVAISDNERVLAFTGIGEDHHVVGRPPLTHLTWETLRSGKVRVARGRQEIGCPVPEWPLARKGTTTAARNGHSGTGQPISCLPRATRTLPELRVSQVRCCLLYTSPSPRDGLL